MSAPFDLNKVTKGLVQSEKALYDNALLEGARILLQKNYKLLKKHEKELKYDLDYLLNDISHIRDIDTMISTQVHGYGNDYTKFYLDISSTHYMKSIKIPSLFIHSLDDPVCIKEMIPIEEIRKNKNCILLLTQSGGHIEFLSGERKPSRWAFKAAFEYLTHQVKLNQNQN